MPSLFVIPNRLTDARLDLAGQIRAEIDAAFTADDALTIGVHDYPPSQLVTPSVFLDMPRVAPLPTGTVTPTVAQFPVVVAFDGAAEAQVRQMDYVAALLMTALNVPDGQAVEAIDPDPIDLGGPQTRSLVLVVDVDLGLDSLCRTTAQLTTAGTH